MSVPSTEHLPPHRHWTNPETLRIAAYSVIIAAGTWFLLGELKSVLRPLLMAVFLGYVLLPYYSRLRRRMPAMLALGLLAGGATLMLALLAAAVTGNLIDLTEQAPALKERAVRVVRGVSEWVRTLPFAPPRVDTDRQPEEVLADRLTDQALTALNVAAVSLPEVLAVGLYLLFLLLESGRFPERVRRAYPEARAEQILDVFGRINAANISYLKAKFVSSVLLAVPVGLVLWFAGVKFAVLWAVLTFVCNFIPYIGSAVAYTLPVAFAFTQSDGLAKPVVVAGLLAAAHVLSASVLEPMLLGRAVGLSPLVILAALTVWGVLWGLPGMFLAVPLTVVVKIVLENLDMTRPLAELLSGK
jgi:AI-2 transport protein TqsA